jgi:hypothetical protein
MLLAYTREFQIGQPLEPLTIFAGPKADLEKDPNADVTMRLLRASNTYLAGIYLPEIYQSLELQHVGGEKFWDASVINFLHVAFPLQMAQSRTKIETIEPMIGKGLEIRRASSDKYVVGEPAQIPTRKFFRTTVFQGIDETRARWIPLFPSSPAGHRGVEEGYSHDLEKFPAGAMEESRPNFFSESKTPVDYASNRNDLEAFVTPWCEIQVPDVRSEIDLKPLLLEVKGGVVNLSENRLRNIHDLCGLFTPEKTKYSKDIFDPSE